MKNKPLILQWIQFFVSFFIFASISFIETMGAYVISDNPFLVWYPIVLWIVLFILIIIENFYHHAFIRLVFMVIVSLTFIGRDTPEVSGYCIAYSLIYFLLMIFTMFVKVKAFEKKSKDKEKTLPEGIYTKRHLYLIRSVIIVVLVCIIVGILLLLFTKLHIIIICLISSVICVSYFLVMSNLTNPFIQLGKAFNKDADIDKFSEGVEALLKNNLYPATKTSLMIIYCYCLMLKDSRKAQELFETIETPRDKQDLFLYEAFLFNIAVDKKEENVSMQILEHLRHIFPKNKDGLKSLEVTRDIYMTMDPIYNILELYPINTKSKVINVSNMSILMDYYMNRYKIEDAKHYAQMIIDAHTNFDELNKSANEILAK